MMGKVRAFAIGAFMLVTSVLLFLLKGKTDTIEKQEKRISELKYKDEVNNEVIKKNDEVRQKINEAKVDGFDPSDFDPR